MTNYNHFIKLPLKGSIIPQKNRIAFINHLLSLNYVLYFKKSPQFYRILNYLKLRNNIFLHISQLVTSLWRKFNPSWVHTSIWFTVYMVGYDLSFVLFSFQDYSLKGDEGSYTLLHLIFSSVCSYLLGVASDQVDRQMLRDTEGWGGGSNAYLF